MSQRVWSAPLIAGAVGSIVIALFWCCALLAQVDDGAAEEGTEMPSLAAEPDVRDDAALDSIPPAGPAPVELVDEDAPAPSLPDRPAAASTLDARDAAGMAVQEPEPVEEAAGAVLEDSLAPLELPPRVGAPQAPSADAATPVPAEPDLPPSLPVQGAQEELELPPLLPPRAGGEPPRPPAPADRTASPPLATAERLDPQERWRQARRAFWEGRFDESVAAYRALIETDPTNWSAHGELGNVLYRQGKWNAAVEAFHDAALLLWESGRRKDARHLARIIGNLQPGREQELMRIFSARGHDGPEYSSYSRLVKPAESQ